MRILIVRLSAMGDLVRTLPALTDATKAIPDIKFDWVVDESFSDVPAWHSHVENVFPVALRRWKRNWVMLSSAVKRSVRQTTTRKITTALWMFREV